ncbi:MAG: acyltransferase [Proteobacteria bacterium]|nr:acyltransferase [Pseudomonadota bacterium]
MTDRSHHRFGVLDGWRGICAALVALHHVEFHGWLYFQPLIRNAWLFVDFFFVLSGFVIAHAYEDRLDSGRAAFGFVLRRFGRLWPLHVTILAIMVALEIGHAIVDIRYPGLDQIPFSGDRAPFAILTNLFLVQSLGFHNDLTWNGPSWSISTEFWTYIVFAAATLPLRGRAARIVAAIVLAAGGAFVLARWSRYGMRETVGWGFARCLYGFFTGVLAHAVWRSGVMRHVAGTAGEMLVLAGALAFLTFVPGDLAWEYAATPLFAAVVLVFAEEGGALSRLLNTRPAAALGRWSYSIYMIHMLLLVVLFSGLQTMERVFGLSVLTHRNGSAALDLHPLVLDDLLMAGFLALTVALAALSWRFVERPGQRWFNRRAERYALETGDKNT